MQSLQNQPGDLPTKFLWQRYRLATQRILGMVLATGILLFFTRVAAPAPCWVVFLLVVLVAFPTWQYRTEYLLFRRRLVLSGAAKPGSRVRALLWQGGVTRVVQVVVSMFLAGILLVLVSRLSLLHWYVLAVDGIFLSFIMGPVTRQLKGEIRDRHRGIIARRWPLFLINGFVLSAALMAFDFFYAGSQDTRHLVWSQVAGQTFIQVSETASCVVWGVSTGIMATLEALSWHFSELVIPSLPGVSAKIIAWLFFLLRTVTVAWLFTALLLGISVTLDKREGRRTGRVVESTFSRSFLLTILILALPFFYASIKLNEVGPQVTREVVNEPCKPDAASRAQLILKLDERVARERQSTIDAVDSGIDQGLDPLFADIEAGVDDYLDWYFTVVGEYQRLAAVFTEDAATTMSEKLEEYLFVRNDFGARLEDLESKVESMSVEQFAGMVPSLKTEIDNAPCTIGRVDLVPLVKLDRDKLRASTAVTSGVGAGIVAGKVLAKKTAATVVGKVAAKKSFYTGAVVASKALAKKGASTALSAGLGVTLCAPTGPVAILCGVAAGLATWLAVDKALVELDESLNREEMRTDMLEVLAEQKAILAAELKQKHFTRVDELSARMNDAVQRTFVPYKDGI